MAPTNLIIFGFTGDLAKRKLLPSLYHLEVDGILGEQVNVIGTSRRELDMDEYRDEIRGHITAADGECVEEHLDALFDRITVVPADISKSEDYPMIRKHLEDIDQKVCRSRVYYFATPATLFEQVIQNLVEHDLHLCDQSEVTRLLIEKPFGHDLESAKQLLETINQTFGEEHIYRLDHYMAKETVQNILHFRFHNPMFSHLLSSEHVAAIHVSAKEKIDIQGRANFYEETGALRDMIQSHLLQVLALTTMDEPAKLDSENIRSKRQELLESIKPIAVEDISTLTTRGQYIGYREEVENPDSRVETYAALELEIDNDRWRGTPVHLTAGKALDRKLTEVRLTFKDSQGRASDDNQLVIRIQPNEGIELRLIAKKPGLGDQSVPVSLDYQFAEDPDDVIHDAYEKIILDAINGDQTLFPTDAEILSNWKLVDPIISHWSSTDEGLTFYPKGAVSPELKK